MNKPLQVKETSSTSAPAGETKKYDKLVHISASVGKGNAHPNEASHYIAWINVLSQPSADRMPGIIGTFECTAYKPSIEGMNPDMMDTFPDVVCFIFKENPRNHHTASYCTAQALWGDLSSAVDE